MRRIRREVIRLWPVAILVLGCGRKSAVVEVDPDVSVPSVNDFLHVHHDAGGVGGGEKAPGLFVASMSNDLARISVECDAPTRAASGRAAIKCRFKMLNITPPRPREDLSKNLDAMRADILRGGKSGLIRACAEAMQYDGGGVEEQVMVGPVRQACASGDLNAYADAFIGGVRAEESEVCDVLLTDWEDEYEQVDQNTWVANKGPEGICRSSSNMTIWRQDARPLSLWNYKQVTSTPPNAKGPFCNPGTVVAEYSSLGIRPRVLPCRFLRM